MSRYLLIHSLTYLFTHALTHLLTHQCSDSIDLLERSRIDFIKLIERINDQKQFTDANPISLSWEIRKPVMYNRPNTNYSYANSPVIHHHQPYVPTIPADTASVISQTKLRASAPEFKPAKQGTSAAALAAVASLIAPSKIEKKNELSSNPPTNTTTVSKQAPTTNNDAKLPLKSTENKAESTDPWDADTEAEVVKASEQIWAEAEAWIEAEAEVEEAAWEVLRLGSSYEDDGSDINIKISSETPHKLPLPLKVDNILVTPSTKSSISNLGSMLSSMSYDDTYNNDENRSDNTIASMNGDSGSVLIARTTNSITKNKNSDSNFSPDALSSQQSSASKDTRSLHDKLSSPDRRRSCSPTEAKRRQEAKQLLAEVNRDRVVNEKKQKAMVSWNRAKLIGEKEAQRLVQAEQALEDRLRVADKRHDEYIKFIKGKAGNENAKVSEVAFINSINSEGIAEQLQHKLEEVEARILAAAQRRQEKIQAITIQRKRKEKQKTAQMSELKLHLEQIKMERWQKLQSRLNSVNQRRLARLAEMKRRSLSDIDEVPAEESGGAEAIPNTLISDDHVALSENKHDKKEQIMSKQQVNSDSIDELVVNFINKPSGGDSTRPLLCSQLKHLRIMNSKKCAITAWNHSITCLTHGSNICDCSAADKYRVYFKSGINSNTNLPGTSSGGRVLSLLKEWYATFDANLLNVSGKDKRGKSAITGGSALVGTNKSVVNTTYAAKVLNILSKLLGNMSPDHHSNQENPVLFTFLQENGVLMLRTLLGKEIGCLCNEDTLTFASSSGLLSNVFKIVRECCKYDNGIEQLTSSGTILVVIDYIYICLLHLDEWVRSRLNNEASSTPLSTNSTSKKVNKKKESPNKSSTNKVTMQWPIEATLLPLLLDILSCALRYLMHSPNHSALNTKLLNAKWIWYIFASGVMDLSCKMLHSMQQFTADIVQYDYPYYFTMQLLFFFNDIARILNISAGVLPTTLIRTTSQLSSKKHVYPHGREMISIIRIADLLPTLVSFLTNLLLDGTTNRRAVWDDATDVILWETQGNALLAAPVYTLCSKILDTLMNLTTVDLSLVNSIPSDSQMSMIHSANRLIKSLMPSLHVGVKTASVTSIFNKAVIIGYDESKAYHYIRVDHSTIEVTSNGVHDGVNEHKLCFTFSDMDICINKLLSSLGLLCLYYQPMQIAVSQGTSPTFLMELCRLPIRYFNNIYLKLHLYPCLIALSYDNECNLNMIKSEISLVLLIEFLTDLTNHVHDTQTVSQVSHRLPVEIWSKALKIYQKLL